MTFSLLRLVGLLGTVAVATLQAGYFSVAASTICTTQNALVPPPEVGPRTLYVDRIAWQLSGPPMTRPLTVNGIGPAAEPELLCMAGCQTPPCWPASTCAPPDLWWAARYDNLTLVGASPAVLPEIVGQMPPLPPMLMVLYDTTSQSPSPRRTTSPTPTSAFPMAAGVPIACPEPNPHATPAAITLGLLLAGATVGLAACWRMNRTAECPYCLGGVVKGHLRAHLDECKQHLDRYTPVVLERVRVVHQTITTHSEAEAGTEDEREDLVARPEAVMTT